MTSPGRSPTRRARQHRTHCGDHHSPHRDPRQHQRTQIATTHPPPPVSKPHPVHPRRYGLLRAQRVMPCSRRVRRCDWQHSCDPARRPSLCYATRADTSHSQPLLLRVESGTSCCENPQPNWSRRAFRTALHNPDACSNAIDHPTYPHNRRTRVHALPTTANAEERERETRSNPHVYLCRIVTTLDVFNGPRETRPRDEPTRSISRTREARIDATARNRRTTPARRDVEKLL